MEQDTLYACPVYSLPLSLVAIPYLETKYTSTFLCDAITNNTLKIPLQIHIYDTTMFAKAIGISAQKWNLNC